MSYCTKCLNPIEEKNTFTKELIKQVYLRDEKPWIIGYSGGKDSSALLKLVINGLIEIDFPKKLITVVYCDTGVEIPVISNYVKKTIRDLRKECKAKELPIQFKILKPKIEDRYFVKVIGRGYPPPTNIFRWCTDRLRINPVKQITDNAKNSILLLGIRSGESLERDRTIAKHSLEEAFFLKQVNNKNIRIFSPILDYSIKDVRRTIKYVKYPIAIKDEVIGKLYKDADTECPVFREVKGQPCGKGRFGCWTCTVVRKDKAVTNMVSNGYVELGPLLKFRNWLAEYRDNPKIRCKQRRNGVEGLGPITLKGRKRILAKLRVASKESGLELLPEEELKHIKLLWKKDRNSFKYMAIDTAANK